MLFVRLVYINDLMICCSYCFTIYSNSNNNDNDEDDWLLKCSFSLFNFYLKKIIIITTTIIIIIIVMMMMMMSKGGAHSEVPLFVFSC